MIGSVRLGMLNVLRTGANQGNGSWRPSWRTEGAIAGGGILVDHGTHLFYQLHSLFGPPSEIACRTEQRSPGMQVEDTATVYLRYTRGLIRIHLTWAASSRASIHRYVGTRGEVACLDDRIEVRTSAGIATQSFADGLSQGSAHSEWFAPLLTEFADSIEARRYENDRLDEAVQTAAYISRAYASAAAGGIPPAVARPAHRSEGSSLRGGRLTSTAVRDSRNIEGRTKAEGDRRLTACGTVCLRSRDPGQAARSDRLSNVC